MTTGRPAGADEERNFRLLNFTTGKNNATSIMNFLTETGANDGQADRQNRRNRPGFWTWRRDADVPRRGEHLRCENSTPGIPWFAAGMVQSVHFITGTTHIIIYEGLL